MLKDDIQTLIVYCCLHDKLQMVAKGKDASDLFPAVVKNVVSKNLEVNPHHPILSPRNFILTHNSMLESISQA